MFTINRLIEWLRRHAQRLRGRRPAAAPELNVRALPERIRVTETYRYGCEVGPSLLRQQVATPGGELRIELPYDNFSHFPRQARDDALRQAAQRRLPLTVKEPVSDLQPLAGQAGHLVLDQYERTDIGSLATLLRPHGALPVLVPLLGYGISDLHQLNNDTHACHVTIRYAPKNLEIRPLVLHFQCTDEPALGDVPAESNGPTDTPEAHDVLQSEAALLAARATLQGGPQFIMQVVLNLPQRGAAEAKHLQIDRMTLTWPASVSHDGVRLYVDRPAGSNQLALRYDPIAGVLIWRNVPLVPGGSAASAQHQAYHSPQLVLVIEQPCDLYEQHRLRCSVEIGVPGRLLSGLQVTYFDALGALARTVKLEMNSRIVGDFDLLVDEIFNHRVRYPVRHLVVEGVLPGEGVISEVEATLIDRGYTIVSSRPFDVENGRQRLLEASSRSGGNMMALRILVDCRRTVLYRPLQGADGQVFGTQIESGEVRVHIRAQLRDGDDQATRRLNRLQDALYAGLRRLRTQPDVEIS